MVCRSDNRKYVYYNQIGMARSVNDKAAHAYAFDANIVTLVLHQCVLADDRTIIVNRHRVKKARQTNIHLEPGSV